LPRNNWLGKSVLCVTLQIGISLQQTDIRCLLFVIGKHISFR
jgi:hypothetical protein